MRILHINCVYPRGSTGKITSDIHHSLLRHGHESFVLYSREKKTVEPYTQRVCGNLGGKINHFLSMLSGYVYGGCGVQTRKIIKKIRKYRPDVVHLQCINGYFTNIYKLVRFLNEQQVPTVLTLHAEFMYTANCGCSFDCEKWMIGCGRCPRLFQATHSLLWDKTHQSFLKMKYAFDGFGDKLTVVGVSNWLRGRAALSPIMKDCRLITIHNGINTAIFRPKDGSQIRSLLRLDPEEKMILWVTSVFSDEKGKDLFFALTELMDSEQYRFVVVGAEKPDGYEGKVTFIGKVSNQDELANYYSAADVMLCCSKQESFPTVCLEAQCCGTPVVGFDVGGVNEAVFNGMGGTVALGDIDAMKIAVEFWSEQKIHITENIKRDCAEAFSFDRMKKEYIELYQSILGNYKS